MIQTETLTTEKLKKLAAYEAPLCLTLTMPCVISGDQQKQNAIRFKNLIQEATDKLQKIGQRQEDIEKFLKPFERFQGKKDAWKMHDKGLLVCIANDIQKIYSLPFPLEVNVIVDRHFYLRPVIPHMQENAKTVIFLLSMNSPTLLFTDSHNGNFNTKAPPSPLTSFEEYMSIYDLEESLQFRSQGSDGGSHATVPGYHGQGVAGDMAQEKKHLKEYFKQLENWVYESLQKVRYQDAFLVAEPHMEGLYKSVMRRNHLHLRKLEQSNPTSEKPEVWVQRAKDIQKHDYSKKCLQTLSIFRQLKKNHGSHIKENIPEIVRAAHNHRIDTLVVPDTSQDYYWGRFDPETHSVYQQKQDESVTGPGDELVNLAVIKTFLNGGKILSIPENILPEKTNYTALCRW